MLQQQQQTIATPLAREVGLAHGFLTFRPTGKSFAGNSDMRHFEAATGFIDNRRWYVFVSVKPRLMAEFRIE